MFVLFFALLALISGQYVTGSQFKCIFPSVSQAKIDSWIPELNQVMGDHGINTYKRVIMFLAQTGHETDSYNTFKEYTNSDGTNKYCKNYGGGCKYIGRGAMQVTHDYNYKQAGNDLGVGDKLYISPDLVATVDWAFKTAGWFWDTHPKLNTCSDAGDVTACTKIINGGTNGLADRKAKYTKASQCIPKFSGVKDNGDAPDPVPDQAPENDDDAGVKCTANANSVRVRGAPCSSSDAKCAQIATLNSGDEVTKVGEPTVANGVTWVKVTDGAKTGYVSQSLLNCASGERVQEEESTNQSAGTPAWVWPVVGVVAGLVVLSVIAALVAYKYRAVFTSKDDDSYTKL